MRDKRLSLPIQQNNHEQWGPKAWTSDVTRLWSRDINEYVLSPQAIRYPSNPLMDEPSSPDYKYNQLARKQGLKQWPVKIFRRLSLRSQADPTYMNAEMVWPMMVRSREQWIRHPEREKVATAVKDLAPEGGWQVNNAFLLGLAVGSLVNVEDRFNRSNGLAPHLIRQFVWFIDTVSLIAQASGKLIPSYVQENRSWTLLERDVLSAYGVGFTHPPVAEELAGLGSFVFLPYLDMDVRYNLLGRCPTLQPDVVWIDALYVEASGDKPAVRGSAIDLIIKEIERVLGILEPRAKAMKDPSQWHQASVVRAWGRNPTEQERFKQIEAIELDCHLSRQRLRHLHDYKATHVEIEVSKYWSLIVRDPKKPLTEPERELCKYCEHEEYLRKPRWDGSRVKGVSRRHKVEMMTLIAAEKHKYKGGR